MRCPVVRSKITRFTAVSGSAYVEIPFLLIPPTPKKQMSARAFENELIAKPQQEIFSVRKFPHH